MEDCKDAPYSEEYYDLLVSYLRLEMNIFRKTVSRILIKILM